MLYFFFFQAEDGIRDGRVTGVQTCALPILSASAQLRGRGRLQGVVTDKATGKPVVGATITIAPAKESTTPIVTKTRSEERRVGKECRSRWSQYLYKKQATESFSVRSVQAAA